MKRFKKGTNTHTCETAKTRTIKPFLSQKGQKGQKRQTLFFSYEKHTEKTHPFVFLKSASILSFKPFLWGKTHKHIKHTGKLNSLKPVINMTQVDSIKRQKHTEKTHPFVFLKSALLIPFQPFLIPKTHKHQKHTGGNLYVF